MLQLTPQTRIFLATEPVDFRKGIDGLGAVCRQRLGHPPWKARSTSSARLSHKKFARLSHISNLLGQSAKSSSVA
jgi:hypothetical protein